MKPGEPRRLVGLEDVDARGRKPPEHGEHRDERDGTDHHEMRPAHTGDEERGREHRDVDERGADVGLGEDEHDRHRGAGDRLQGHGERADLLRARGEEAGEEHREQNLAELRGLEGEETDVDPAPGAAGGGAEDEQERHHRAEPDVGDPAEAPVEGRLDQGARDEQHEPHRGVERLPARGAAAGIVPRDAADRPDAVGDRRERGARAAPSRSARGARRGPAPARARRFAGCGCAGRRPRSSSAHQSEMWEVTTPSRWKYCSKTWSAAGAAAVPP